MITRANNMNSSNNATLLQYLSSQTQIDIDSFDDTAVVPGWSCQDATSNQAEVYEQLSKESNHSIIEQAISLATSRQEAFPGITLPELAAEIGALLLAIRMTTKVPGAVHVMCNPKIAFNTTSVVKCGQRLHQMLGFLDPSIDRSRLVLKIAATYEGMIACQELQRQGVPTLATTVFCLEQAMMAGEVGCVSICPFVHELKVHVDNSYKDADDILNVCVHAQKFYKIHNMPTRVKACATVGMNEILQLAGISAQTIMLPDLEKLASTRVDEIQLPGSLVHRQDSPAEEPIMPYQDYAKNEANFRLDFAKSHDGRAQFKLMQALGIFCDYQDKLESLFSEMIRLGAE